MASKTGHVHQMQVISWRPRPADLEAEVAFREAFNERAIQLGIKDRSGLGYPAVLLACVSGVCSRTLHHVITPRMKTLPEGLRQEAFDLMRQGYFWNEFPVP